MVAGDRNPINKPMSLIQIKVPEQVLVSWLVSRKRRKAYHGRYQYLAAVKLFGMSKL